MSDGFPKLTPTQINALVVLMAEARELTNNELKELAGFSLTGTDNKKLVDLGLVETDKSHRPYSHHLTDKGWKVMREEVHAAQPPKAGGSAARSLFTLLANLHRSLDRLHVSYADFFKQTATPVDVEARIRAAYTDLASSPGIWIGLADLRDNLADLDRRSTDDALRAMLTRPGVRIIPVANTKSLTDRDRAAALRIGEEDNHTISIGSA